MWIRSAFFEGSPAQENAAAFRAAIEREVAPAIACLDGVRDVETLWPRAIEDRNDDMLCQMLVHFDDESGIARMMASEGRADVRAKVAELTKVMEIRISHINYEVT